MNKTHSRRHTVRRSRLKNRPGDPSCSVGQGGLRYIGVWQSQEHWDRFVEERLHPAVHGLLSEVFGDDLPPEPERTPLPMIHAWTQ